MKVLFFGATGVVGQRVIPLLADSFELVLAGLVAGELNDLPVHAVDVRDMDATLALMDAVQPDAVVNCAIADYSGTRQSRSVESEHAYHESTIDVNVRGAYHLYEAASRAQVPNFVFISSLTVITGTPRYPNIVGDEAPRPSNVYACTKLFGESIGSVYAHTHDMNVTCLRLGHPYPIVRYDGPSWLEDPDVRGMMVHFEDIAGAVRGALCNPVNYGVHSIVSDSDSRWLENVAVPEIGYKPHHFFTAAGSHLLEPSGAGAS